LSGDLVAVRAAREGTSEGRVTESVKQMVENNGKLG